jgi:hypothetical protein
MKLPLIKGSQVDSNAEWRDFLPVNMTAFVQQIGTNQGYIRTMDGLTLFSNGFGPDRGGIWSERLRRHLRVNGERLIEVTQFGGVVDLAGPIAGTNQVNFANSFNSVAFTANGEYYHWDGTTLTTVTKPLSAGDFIDITWIDGYYVLTDGENLWATDIADELTISSISFAGSDFAPDEIVGLGKSTDNKLIAYNRYTTERFYNNAGPQFPFARIPTAAIPIGIVGTKCKVNIGDGQWVVFGGSKEYSPGFYLLTNSYQSIATKEIDNIIDTYSDFELSNIQLEFRDTRDQSLVICHLPRHCLVYDLSYSRMIGQNVWYEWRSGDLPWRGVNGVYDPRNVAEGPSSWIYGDKQDERLGKLDTDVCTQYGEDLEWFTKTPLVQAGQTVKAMEVLTTAGYGSEDNPVVFVSTTKDGSIFGPEIMISSGGQGEYDHRIIVRRLGDYPNWFGIRIRGNSANITTLAGCEVL